MKQRKKHFILLLHLSNQYLQCIKVRLLIHVNYQSGMPEILRVSGKRQVHMAKMYGEFLEFISSRRLNNLYIVQLINLGMN